MKNNTQELLSELSNKIEKSIDSVKVEKQNAEYQGMIIRIEGVETRFRMSKVTPKKAGSFVAFWEKDSQNKNKPYDLEQSPNQLFIYVEEEGKQGYFLFDKEILTKKKIYTSGEQKGKMAMRVYPDWCTDLNKQAARTQEWQSKYFIQLN